MQTPAAPDWWPKCLQNRDFVREVLVCGRQLHPPAFSHVVTFPRLEIPLVGCYENQFERDGVITTLGIQPGAALFAPPNCWNSPTWRLRVEVMSILFGKRQLGISVVSARKPGSPELKASKFSISHPLNGPIPHILEAMLELQQTPNPQSALPELTRALLWCVKQLVEEAPAEAQEGRSQNFFERICVYLQSHYQNDITRDSVAQQFSVTPSHLSRLFHNHGHMTFINYLTHVRIARSKFMLGNYSLKLEEIAARCGFRDAPYFCRVFKRLTKTTPAEYRARSTPPEVRPATKR